MRRLPAILCLAVIVAAGACAPPNASTTSSLVPGFLIGTWRTDAVTHREAFLRLTATTIAFGTVEGNVERYVVERVTRTQDFFGTLYTIEYRDLERDLYHLGLYFDGRSLRLRNQLRMPWKWSRF